MAQAPDIPKRIPLIILPENRDDSTSKDSRLVNAFTERDSMGDYWIYKRPGLLEYDELIGNGSGLYNWNGDLYAAQGTTLYKNGASHGTINGAGGVYRFSQTLGATPRLVLGNGAAAYTTDGTTLTQITDPDFPVPFRKGWAYLDGTTYVSDISAGVYGSDINLPQDWDPLNVLIAQIEPDPGVALAKQLVYVVVFKGWSTEIFYDAENATGSPLGRVQGAKVSFGCVSQDSMQTIDDTLLWVATNRQAGVQVVMMENLKSNVVSTKAIERLLDSATFSAGNVFSWVTQIDGHRFYVLTLKADNLTLVYDLDSRMWSQWTDTDGNYFPIVAATFLGQQRILQHETNGKLYTFDGSYFSDDGSLITVDIYTPNFDGGTRLKKQMNWLEFIGDQVPGSVLQVRKSDDDYQTWSNFRDVDLSNKRPMLQNCGTFSRRAHNFRHRKNTHFRLQAVEPKLLLGTL